MERELMEQYPNKQPASTDDAPQRYVVFDQLDYRVRGAVMARNWDEARELGAKKLRVRPSVVWAAAVYDGETDEQAWKREVSTRGKRGAK